MNNFRWNRTEISCPKTFLWDSRPTDKKFFNIFHNNWEIVTKKLSWEIDAKRRNKRWTKDIEKKLKRCMFGTFYQDLITRTESVPNRHWETSNADFKSHRNFEEVEQNISPQMKQSKCNFQAATIDKDKAKK